MPRATLIALALATVLAAPVAAAVSNPVRYVIVTTTPSAECPDCVGADGIARTFVQGCSACPSEILIFQAFATSKGGDATVMHCRGGFFLTCTARVTAGAHVVPDGLDKYVEVCTLYTECMPVRV